MTKKRKLSTIKLSIHMRKDGLPVIGVSCSGEMLTQAEGRSIVGTPLDVFFQNIGSLGTYNGEVGNDNDEDNDRRDELRSRVSTLGGPSSKGVLHPHLNLLLSNEYLVSELGTKLKTIALTDGGLVVSFSIPQQFVFIPIENSKSLGSTVDENSQMMDDVDYDSDELMTIEDSLSDAGGGERRTRVLVIDDNMIQRRVQQEILEAQGHHCEAVSNGLAALTRCFEILERRGETPGETDFSFES